MLGRHAAIISCLSSLCSSAILSATGVRDLYPIVDVHAKLGYVGMGFDFEACSGDRYEMSCRSTTFLARRTPYQIAFVDVVQVDAVDLMSNS